MSLSLSPCLSLSLHVSLYISHTRTHHICFIWTPTNLISLYDHTYICHVLRGNTEDVGAYPQNESGKRESDSDPFAGFDGVNTQHFGDESVSDQRDDEENKTQEKSSSFCSGVKQHGEAGLLSLRRSTFVGLEKSAIGGS